MSLFSFISFFVLFLGCVVMGLMGILGSIDISHNSFMFDFTYNINYSSWIALAVLGCIFALIFGALAAHFAYSSYLDYDDVISPFFGWFVVGILMLGLVTAGVAAPLVKAEKEQVLIINHTSHNIYKDKKLIKVMKGLKKNAENLFWDNKWKSFLSSISLENKTRSKIRFEYLPDNQIKIIQQIYGKCYYEYQSSQPISTLSSNSTNYYYPPFFIPIIFPPSPAPSNKYEPNTMSVWTKEVTLIHDGNFNFTDVVVNKIGFKTETNKYRKNHNYEKVIEERLKAFYNDPEKPQNKEFLNFCEEGFKKQEILDFVKQF